MAMVGTSGWSYPEWKDTFYAGIPQRAWLEHYASVFGAVEAHMTARRRLTENVALRWTQAVGPDFRFATKAPPWTAAKQVDLVERAERFVASLDPLGAAAGPVLVAPPFARDEAALESLLEAWPGGVDLAIELRHPSWHESQAATLARKHRAALVVTDRNEGTNEVTVTADHSYVRLRRAAYDAATLDRWAATITKMGTRPWVFIRHAKDAPHLARYLRDRLA